MIRKQTPWLAVALLLVFALSACGGIPLAAASPVLAESDTLYQVSLLNALMLGDYDGTVSVAALKNLGDTGLGTFDQLDGELIMIGGAVYKAKADGTVEKQPDNEKVPFAVVTRYDNDLGTRTLTDRHSLEAIKQALDQIIAAESAGFNRFYVAVIDGSFAKVHVRSVPAQTKPYKPLAEIAKSQPEYDYPNVTGTIIALRCPDYVDGINLPGWHFHFISTDKTKGGHVLDADLTSSQLGLDYVSDFQIKLPDTPDFAGLDLEKDLKADTSQVESK